MSIHAPHLGDKIEATGLNVAIVVSRFNAHITDALLDGAKKALLDHGFAETQISVFYVPGAFEISTVANRLAQLGGHQAIVCLGCVMRGATAHFEYVCQGVTDTMSKLAQRGDIGLGNGVLTLDTEEQAQERIGGKHGHKGAEAALTAVEIACLLQSLEG
ncbi:MAG: 6,7-dimethyl-8-ribityllumazine synthase [Mariprofundaceae bacterium]|nr:6,7-dimethyl-8-ribityllumazine synthase [Mariprofundaceae bacterium]